MAIEVEIIRQTDQFARLREDWDRLMEGNPIKSIFLTWSWLFTWWSFFGADNQLHILVVRESQKIAGIAPLMTSTIKRKGLKFRMLSNLGSSNVDVSGFIYDPKRKDVFEAICKAINTSANWDLFELGEFPNSAIDPGELLCHFPGKLYLNRVIQRPHIFIPTSGNWDEFYKSLPKHLRRVLKRKERLIQEEGRTVRFQRFQRGMVRPDHLQTVFEINQRAHFPDLYASRELEDFHLKLADSGILGEEIDISLLYLDETPVAFEYGFTMDNVYEAWRGAFDTAFQDFAPGSLIFQYLLADSFKKGYSGIDLMRGDHEYKRRWGGFDRDYTLLWIVPRKKIAACLLFIWLPLLKKKMIGFFEKKPANPEPD